VEFTFCEFVDFIVFEKKKTIAALLQSILVLGLIVS